MVKIPPTWRILMPLFRPLYPALILLTFALALFTGCSKDNPAKPKAPSDCGGLSGSECAAQKVLQANESLEDILYTSLIGDPQRPDDIDVRVPLALYRAALDLDPGNNDAHFGVAVLELLALSTDEEVNAAFDEWKAYLDQHVPFEATNAAAGPLRPLGVPLAFSPGRTALALPFEVVARSVLAQARASMTLADPQLARVQAILRDRVLPRLTDARDHLGIVAADVDYRYIVTPRMQGDESASPAEIDRTDILALRAGCGLLAAACHVAVSYELNFAAYDSTSLVQAFQPGSGWLTLRSDGAAHMSDARTALLGSVDDVDAAITSLLAETDNQDDDVIKTDPYDFRRQDLDSIQAHLPDVRDALDGGYTRVEDWDSDPFTPPVSLTFRIGALFTNPVPDWKALFPPYTATARRQTESTSYQGGSGTATKSVTVPYSTYYDAYYSIYVYNGEMQAPYFYGDESLVAAAQEVMMERLDLAQAQAGWDGSFYGSASFYGNLIAGTQDAAFSWWESYGVATRYVFVPVITWDAATFDQWDWPDPTLHGLLPDMGSSAQLLGTFGITADQWTREVVLDWTDLNLRASHPPLPSLTPRLRRTATARSRLR
jgi:hypothetical protein